MSYPASSKCVAKLWRKVCVEAGLVSQALQVPQPGPAVIVTVDAFLRRVSGRELACCPHCGFWTCSRRVGDGLVRRDRLDARRTGSRTIADMAERAAKVSITCTGSMQAGTTDARPPSITPCLSAHVSNERSGKTSVIFLAKNVSTRLTIPLIIFGDGGSVQQSVYLPLGRSRTGNASLERQINTIRYAS
jgi:hypothetical protein